MTGETRIGLLGGLYSNYLALEAALADLRRVGVEQIFCLGDLGAFGPHPDRVFPLLSDAGVVCLRGNYDDSIGRELSDCQCGYTDPRDNHFARLSYEYTLANTSRAHREFLRDLPEQIRLDLDGRSVLLCHGSPRRVNEFLWRSTTSTPFLDYLLTSCEADVVLATHTGIKWTRGLSGGRLFANVGVLGRPENDGRRNVWCAVLSCSPAGEARIAFRPIEYDVARLAREMRDEGLPDEFIETIETGWWTTCLEILPAKERRAGKH